MLGELERIERRLIELDGEVKRLRQESAETRKDAAEILKLLQGPTDYPASTGGTVTAK